MTIPLTHWQLEFEQPTTDSSVLNSPIQATVSGISPCQILAFAIPQEGVDLPAHVVALSDYTREIEADAHRRNSLRDARQEVNALLYAGQPPTLRNLRLRVGISQTQLAERIGTSQSQVARLEAGRQEPMLDTLDRIADALGIDPGEVIGAARNTRRVA